MEPSYYIRAGTREYIRNKFTAEDSNIYLKKKKKLVWIGGLLCVAFLISWSRNTLPSGTVFKEMFEGIRGRSDSPCRVVFTRMEHAMFTALSHQAVLSSTHE